jgi:hypothetical protein
VTRPVHAANGRDTDVVLTTLSRQSNERLKLLYNINKFTYLLQLSSYDMLHILVHLQLQGILIIPARKNFLDKQY